ncbi:nicotianamine synthase [Quercus suber]|uniref:Nicotianamine synthase n=1 Tax=Quercus suber TaxID=58331 RepID=A0AAW0L6W6_QUESU
MLFHANDIMDVTTYKCFGRLRSCFLGSFCGHRQGEEKVQNVHNFAEYVAPGALLRVHMVLVLFSILLLILMIFEVLIFFAVCHAMDEVINSVIIARKYSGPMQF